MIAIVEALLRDGRLANRAAAERWLKELHWPLWEALKGFKVLQWAGAKVDDKVPFGIRSDSFALHPLSEEVSRCRSCAYVMGEALLGVCLRCGQDCERVSADDVRNYFRLSALHAPPGSPFDDPHPLRSGEHTAQVDSNEARDEERWFQDMFRDDQNPLDHRVDVLSVTTTMEMGIDIGSLLFVGLRNVPPTVANYQQRAGRAGRRGSSIAAVFTFAQSRSHDRYYFDKPPEIVSDPPRVPALHTDNEVIARRHVRSLVLQDFFLKQNPQGTAGLFQSWGRVSDFGTKRTPRKMRGYVAKEKAILLARCERVVQPRFFAGLDGWIAEVTEEVQKVVDARAPDDELFEALIQSGLLPKYAFPVDVVSLSIPDMRRQGNSDANYGDVMQRDLKIAVAEYAPGAEIIRQSSGETYKYRSVGVYDPFAKEPDYSPTGILLECEDCRSVTPIGVSDVPPGNCQVCGSLFVDELPYLRPRGSPWTGRCKAGGGRSTRPTGANAAGTRHQPACSWARRRSARGARAGPSRPASTPTSGWAISS